MGVNDLFRQRPPPRSPSASSSSVKRWSSSWKCSTRSSGTAIRQVLHFISLEFQLEMFYLEFWNSYHASSFYIIRVPAVNVLPRILEQLSGKFFCKMSLSSSWKCSTLNSGTAIRQGLLFYIIRVSAGNVLLRFFLKLHYSLFKSLSVHEQCFFAELFPYSLNGFTLSSFFYIFFCIAGMVIHLYSEQSHAQFCFCPQVVLPGGFIILYLFFLLLPDLKKIFDIFGFRR